MEFQQFDPALGKFLKDLRRNNKRQWFQAHKGRYEGEVLEPARAFIRGFAAKLRKISPFFVASDDRVGGSLMRIYRDTRFSKDKTPYKTNVGIQFRHEQGRDVHAPGFYVHLEPGEYFLALGVWKPDRDALARIREAILDRPEQWKRVFQAKKFRACGFALIGESLKRPPRDCPADHPLMEDLKRTDFAVLRELDESDVYGDRFVERVAETFVAGSPLMRFLCTALGLPY